MKLIDVSLPLPLFRTFSYRVRSEAESFERVVAEADLALPDLP